MRYWFACSASPSLSNPVLFLYLYPSKSLRQLLNFSGVPIASSVFDRSVSSPVSSFRLFSRLRFLIVVIWIVLPNCRWNPNGEEFLQARAPPRSVLLVLRFHFFSMHNKNIAFFYMFGDVWTEDYDSRVSCVYRFGDLFFSF